MASEHIVVDGSNVATEGRSAPSLAQLEEAVAELRREYPDAEITVIVDATFSHRIDPSELERFEKAALEGEYVHPPAGAIGRGDAFLLRIAEKVDAVVLSNDSFKEFHGEHPWLFERGRLLGATPVPGVGWIFTPRTPVRGPASRKAVQDTKAADKARKKISKAIEVATKEAVAPSAKSKAAREVGSSAAGGRGSRRAAQQVATAAAVNDPLTFISFIAEHPLGTEVEGEVEGYTSHGAVVSVDSTRGYLPLANMAVPAPRSARELLKKGERRNFVVTALDPQRRGVELALPGVAVVSGRPSEEMIAAEVRLAKKAALPAKKTTAKKAASKKAAAPKNAPSKRSAAPTKATKEPSARRTTAAGAPEAAQPARRASSATKAATRRSSKAPEQPAAKRAAAAKKAPASPATSNEPRKSPATLKRAAVKKAAPAKRGAGPRKTAPTKKTAAGTKKNATAAKKTSASGTTSTAKTAGASRASSGRKRKSN